MSSSFLRLPSSRPEQIARSTFIASSAMFGLLLLAGPSRFGVGNVIGLIVGFVIAFLVIFLAQLAMSRSERNSILIDERDAIIEARAQKAGFVALLLPLILWLTEAGRASLGADPLLFDYTNPSHCLFVGVGGLIVAEWVKSLAMLWFYGRGAV